MTQFTARFVSRKPHLRTIRPTVILPANMSAPTQTALVETASHVVDMLDAEQVHARIATLRQSPAMQAYFAKKAAEAAAEPVFKPSAEQQAYFDWIKESWGSALVEAVAGSGKTTTLVQGLQYMEGSIFFGAYGKDAATDIQTKARKAKVDRQGIRMSTMHSAGFGAFRQAFPRVAVDDRKVGNLIRDWMQIHPRREQIDRSIGFISKMVSYARQYLFGCTGYPAVDNLDEWKTLCEHFSADADLIEEVKLDEALEWTQIVFEHSRRQCETLIDFDDMIYAPIAYGCRFFQNDWVIGDEWQDANPARREIAKRLLKPRGRAVFVGDDRQSIFGFTGAAHDSLDVTAKMFNCQRLSLSVTYRCPKTVVNFVKTEIDPTYTIRAHADAAEGAVRPIAYAAQPKVCSVCAGTGIREETDGRITTCDYCAGIKPMTVEPWFMQDRPSIEDAILCRYTKPLIATAYAMIKNGIACKVEGRDLGKNLIALARMWKITNIRTLKERLAAYLVREIDKARAMQSEKREQEITDRVETLGIFIERCETMGKTLISDVVAEIEALFADNVTDMIRLSTGHKAKGREWPRVFWLRTGRRQQRKEWEMISERNIEIVIGTRPLGELIMVPEHIHSAKRK